MKFFKPHSRSDQSDATTSALRRVVRRWCALSATTALCSLAVSTQAYAQREADRPLWEIGAVGIGLSQQAYPGASESIGRALVIPFGIYRGELLRIEGGGANLRAMNTPRFELDLGVSGSLGGRADDTVARRGMADLGTLVEIGPRLRWNITDTQQADYWRLDLPLRGVFDLSNGLATRGAVFEPELSYSHRDREGWTYSTGISMVWANQAMNTLLYGVNPQEATATRTAYEAKAGLLTMRLSGSVSKLLNRDTRLIAFGRIDSVNGAANQASPLVQQNTGLSAGLVLAYTWKQSEARAAD
jgi:outer membrane scaffolding protein for murein synthesis (MipA/OmpV family)